MLCYTPRQRFLIPLFLLCVAASLRLVFTGHHPTKLRLVSAARHVYGGIEGHFFENEGLMKRELKRLASEQQSNAEKQGLKINPQLLRCETSNDFVKYASKQGATVEKKGAAYWRVQNGQVWWALSTTRQQFKKKEVKDIIFTAYKAMGIAFGK